MGTDEALGRRARALDLEGEEVVGRDRGRLDQGVAEFFLDCLPLDVDIARRSSAFGQPKVEGKASLQQPLAGRDLFEAGKETVEGNSLAVTNKACAFSGCTGPEPLLERLPKRDGVAVSQAARSVRRRSMSVRTRVARPVAAARSRRGVVRPRSSACWMASSICSG
jgi:hypothetical protein